MQWYYAEDGEQHGPFSDTDFVKLVEESTVEPATLVWNETMTDWQSCQAVRNVIDQISRENKGESVTGGGTFVSCVECGGMFPEDEVIPYKNSYVCGNCKQAFFQRLEEGGTFVRGEGGIGETSNEDLTARAREALQGKWGTAVVFTLLYIIVMQAFQGLAQLPMLAVTFLRSEVASVVATIITMMFIYLFVGAFQLGVSRFYLDLVRDDMQGIGRLFYGFKFFWKAAGTYLLMMLIIFLWTLLLIIPGIIAGLSYAMVFYILADNPEIGSKEALARSKQIMYGNRIKLFCLSCRFIGWTLLAMLSCGIGMLWVQPYMLTSFAEFYEDVRGIQ